MTALQKQAEFPFKHIDVVEGYWNSRVLFTVCNLTYTYFENRDRSGGGELQCMCGVGERPQSMP